MCCRFWTHLAMAYAFTLWTCYVLKREYQIVATMRLNFLASERRRPDQFTVRSSSITCIVSCSLLFFIYAFDVNWWCRFLSGMCHQILMNQSVSLWNTFSWSTIQITISPIRFDSLVSESVHLPKYWSLLLMSSYCRH